MRAAALFLVGVLVFACSLAPPDDGPLPDSAFARAHDGVVYEQWPDVARRPYGGAGRNGMPAGFVDEMYVGGLSAPTAVRFLPDGSVLIAEQAGLLKLFTATGGGEARVVLDLRLEVLQRQQLGLLGLAVDPEFGEQPFVYLAYTRDAVLGGQTPTYGTNEQAEDECPSRSACPASARVVRYEFDPAAGVVEGEPTVLIDDWCISGPNHTIGTLAFGPDGALYAGGGDGADGDEADYGQVSDPPNACADPPGAAGEALAPPSAEGGSLRSQDLRLGNDPLTLDGTIVRVDRATGAALPDSPLAGSADANARRIIAYGLRNPYRFTFRPDSAELWIADVGWNTYEEINRLADSAPDEPYNLGWPCFEGPDRQPVFEALALDACADLYEPAAELTFPAFSFARGAHRKLPCDSPSAATSAIAFYDGGLFPERFDGALFFADLARRCLFVIEADADGLPDPRTVRAFAHPVRATDMVVGPDGALYYLDLVAGELRRIAWR